MKHYTTLCLSLSALFALSACNKPTEQVDTNTPSVQTQESGAHAETKAPAQASTTELSAETQAYKTWVQSQIDGLLSDSEKFVTLLNEGNVAEAKALYPHVRMYFERSEPIAELFGELDPKIDNREADLAAGEAWTGFHAIEKILWTKNTTEGTKELGKTLLTDIKALQTQLTGATVTGELMVQGSVDLLNEISTSKITGEEEVFSHTDLYDFYANVEGAYKIFEILTPKLTEKDPELVKTIQAQFDAVYAELNKYKVGDKDFKSYADLSEQDTKALGEAIHKLGEPLAQMGIILQ